MIKREDILSMEYLKKTEYTGSHQGMRYRMEKLETEVKDESGEEKDPVVLKELLVTVWPEPFNFISTPAEKKTSKKFSFDEDGVVDAIAWMNDQLFEKKEIWDGAPQTWNAYDKM